MKKPIIDHADKDNLDTLRLYNDDLCYFGESMARKMLHALSVGL